MRFREDFSLYARPMKDGRKVWHYKAYTESGKRVSFSTGMLSKTLARKHCAKLKAEGRLIPRPEDRPPVPTLREWAASESWWQWGKCRYLRAQLARSDADKPAVSRRYADDALRELGKYILPAFGDLRLDAITPKHCEDWLFELEAKGLSHKSVNNKASIARIMLGEAARLRVISESPWLRVKGFKPSKHPKGILALEEYRQPMDPATMATVWKDSLVYYSASLLASVTGLRLGEVLALKRADLFPDHVHVAGSWSGKKYGLGRTKTKRIDDIPIPGFVYQTVDAWCTWQGFLFSFQRGARPCSGNRAADALIAALEAIGIPDEERRRRGLSFHSWRAFANTFMRARGISGEKTRQLTRHASEEMTEHYSAWRLEDFEDVAKAQAELVGPLEGRKSTSKESGGEA